MVFNHLGFTEVQVDISADFLSSAEPVTQSKKEIRLVRQDLLFLHPCWVGLISWVSCMCCVIGLKMICSIILSGIKIRLILLSGL